MALRAKWTTLTAGKTPSLIKKRHDAAWFHYWSNGIESKILDSETENRAPKELFDWLEQSRMRSTAPADASPAPFEDASYSAVAKPISASAPVFAIIGAGLIGCSLGRAIRRRAMGNVVLLDRDLDIIAQVEALDICDRVGSDVTNGIEDADIVVLATPVSAFPALMKAIGPKLRKGTIVTDVGSVKGRVIAEIASLVPDGVHFVPGHPIAGSDRSGPAASTADLFAGRLCVLTPSDIDNAEPIGRVASLWRGVGMEVELMDPDLHDRILALTSHMPHLVAFATMLTMADMEYELGIPLHRFSAGGFRDFTRIGAADPVLWRDVFLRNDIAVKEVVEMVARSTTRLLSLAQSGKIIDLETELRSAQTRRRYLNDYRVESEPIVHQTGSA